MYDGENFEDEDELDEDIEDNEDADCIQKEAAGLLAEGKVIKADGPIKIGGHLSELSEEQIAEQIRSSEQRSARLLEGFVNNPSRENIDSYIDNLVGTFQLRRLGNAPANPGNTLDDGVKAANDALRNAGSSLRIALSSTEIPKGVSQMHFQVSDTANNQRRLLYENSSHLIGRPLDALGGDAIYNPELIRPHFAGPWAAAGDGK